MNQIPEFEKRKARAKMDWYVVTYPVKPYLSSLLCSSLKNKYDEIPWFIERVVIEVPEEKYSERITFLLEAYGIDLPPDEEERSDRDSRVRRRETNNINEEKISILNEAVNLGCKWAIDEMERSMAERLRNSI